MKYKLGVLCDLITKREEVNKTIIDLSNIYFEQRLIGWIGGEQVILTAAADTATTTTMISLDKDMIENFLLNVPKYLEQVVVVVVAVVILVAETIISASGVVLVNQ